MNLKIFSASTLKSGPKKRGPKPKPKKPKEKKITSSRKYDRPAQKAPEPTKYATREVDMGQLVSVRLDERTFVFVSLVPIWTRSERFTTKGIRAILDLKKGLKLTEYESNVYR